MIELKQEEAKKLIENMVALSNLLDEDIKENEIYEDFESWIAELDNRVDKGDA